MDKRERGSGRRSRWGAWLLAAALMCALWSGAALAAPAEGASLIAESAAPKPQVTIQGNVVVDKGKPTGFYELALCVRTARTVTEKGTDKVVDEEVYAAELAAALASGKPEDRAALDEKYDVRNYPFQAASAAMTVNLDALTAVTWGAGTPVYEAWTATGTSTSGTYADHDADYPRGINTKADGQPDIFTDLSPVENATGGQKVRVRLDTAKPDEVNNATAFIEEMDTTNHTGLLTLSANTTTTRKVVYEVPTPVVVIRFAYDKNRFKNLEVGNPDDLVSEPNTSDFWLGLDRNHPLDGPNVSGKTPLTYLGAQATGGAHLYADSDAQVAGSSVFQSVLYTQNLADDGVTQEPTRFYYYLGAETPSYEGTKREYLVHDEATDTDSEETLYVPTTLGTAILANRDGVDPTAGDPETGTYSFFQNLLTIKDNTKESTLRLILVNAETYRKPTGGVGGAQILFYDWNDDLIGALVVDPEGDARALVNEYVEKTFIHPELRASALAEGAKDLTELPTQPEYPKYQNLVSSLERDYTYRGDYAYTVGEDNDPNKIFGPDSDEPGEDYPLTDKLDYAFYRRVTTQVEKDVPDPKDPTKTVKTRYYATAPVEEGPDAAFLEEDEEYDGYLYPYVYGWAIVEDETQDLTAKNWILHKDSVKTEDVWTTFGVGELADLDPANAAAQTIPGTTTNYTYAVTEKDAAWYLRFADFSAMEKMLRPGQDVLIVKAVYEPGRSLLKGTHYAVVEDSLHVERYSYAASTGAAVYSFQYQYRRANKGSDKAWHGVGRTREPAVQTGFTYDVNAFDSENKDLDPTVDTNAFFLKSIANNDDILNIDLTTGGVLWKLDYLLVDIYGATIASGAQRSNGGELDLKKNFDYDFGEGVEYPDRQGTDGFVLQATMNTLLAEATKAAKGEGGNLQTHLTEATIADLNLRANENGDAFDWSNYDSCITYFQDLVTRLYASNDPQYRDPKTGNIVLGWHQIQRHILFCMKAGSAVPGIYDNGVLMSETACAGFPWCRLDSCAAEMTVDIYTIGDILAAIGQAEGETGDKRPATEALNKLLTDNPSLLDTFWLRKSEIGEKFPEGAGHRQAVLDALKKVYADLKKAGVTDPDALKTYTQEQVQEVIITGTKPSTPVQTYWWANGGKRPVTGWQDFIEGGMLVVSGKVPDALDAMTNDNPALANAVNDMISYAPPTGAPANVGWFRYKESQEEDNAFQSVEQFKDAWMKALRTLSAHYTLPDQWDSIPWEEIQYALIEPAGDYKTAEEILRAKKDYWWKNGGQPKLTYERLMEAASEWRANGFTDSAKLDKLLAKGVAPINNEVYIRRTAAGSGFTGVDQFKDALKLALQVLGFVNNSGDFLYDSGGLRFSEDPVTHEKTYALSIYQFQYLLLNASRLVGQDIPDSVKIEDPNDPDVVCNYWWIPAPHTPTEAQRIGDIMDLLTYAYWARDGVEVDGVKQPLSIDPLAKLDVATLERLKLRPEEHGVPFTDETYAVLKQKILDVLDCLPYDIDTFSAQSAADLTKEVQYALLHNSYQNAAGITENYWWQGAGFTADTHATLAQAGWMAAVGFGGKTVPDAMDAITNLDFITRRTDLLSTGMAMRSNLSGTAYASIDAFKSALRSAVQAAAAADPAFTFDKITGFTNYQLQYLLLNGVYKSDADVKAEVIVDGVDAYWWFTADKPPETTKKEELFPDETEWNLFLDSAIGYFKKTAGNPAGFVYDLTDEKLKDVLRLRKGPNDSDVITATEMFDGSKTDLLWQVMTALNTSSRKSYFITGPATKRSWKNKPTWAEFQYVLLHLNDVDSGWEMPSTEDCAAEKENYEWMWVSTGKVEYEPNRPDETEWSSFLDSAIGYFKKTAGNPAGFVYTLTEENLKDTLLLRKGPNDSDVITPTEMFDGSKTDLVWQVMTALNTSSRKSDFITGPATKRSWKNKPTWAEFQYVLLHLNDVDSGWEMPSTEECEAWVTQENTPWGWKEKAAGASLLSLEEEPPVPLAAIPDDMLTTDIVENGPMGASGPTMGNDDPDATDEPISVGRDDLDTPDEPISVGRDDPGAPVTPDETDDGPTTDETAEIPLGDEMAAVQRASVAALAATPSGGPSFPCGKDSTPRPPKKDFPNGPRPAGGPGLPQIFGLRPQIYAALAAEGGNPLSERSPSIGFSPLGGLGTDRVPLQRLCVGRDDPGAPLDPDAPTTNERSIMCLMAGPMILPLSLRRTTR